jgi:hypothetical protein
MTGPLDPVQGQEFWEELQKQESLFPDVGDEFESTDLIVELNAKLEELEDLCGRLSFSMREISQVLKIKSPNY